MPSTKRRSQMSPRTTQPAPGSNATGTTTAPAAIQSHGLRSQFHGAATSQKPPLDSFPAGSIPAAISLPASPPDRSSAFTTPPPRRRSVCVRPRRLELFQSRSRSPSRSPSPPRSSPTLQNSYSFIPSGTPNSVPPAANASALKIQRAWRRYRTLSARSFCEFGGEAVRLVQRFMSGADFDHEEAQTPSSRAHLILHFDVNKTILISDAAKGANQADMINMLISECAWGRMTVGNSPLSATMIL